MTCLAFSPPLPETIFKSVHIQQPGYSRSGELLRNIFWNCEDQVSSECVNTVLWRMMNVSIVTILWYNTTHTSCHLIVHFIILSAPPSPCKHCRKLFIKQTDAGTDVSVTDSHPPEQVVLSISRKVNTLLISACQLCTNVMCSFISTEDHWYFLPQHIPRK